MSDSLPSLIGYDANWLDPQILIAIRIAFLVIVVLTLLVNVYWYVLERSRKARENKVRDMLRAKSPAKLLDNVDERGYPLDADDGDVWYPGGELR